MNKIHLIEPQRWNTILNTTIQFSEKYPRLEQFAPIGADIFTFIYPVFLIFLYLKGSIKKQLDRKEGALFIFFSCLITALINIFIQCFFLKSRPNIDLFNDDVNETLLHDILPNSSFPSDHAVVWMSIAIATLIRGYKTKNKNLTFFWYILTLCALIMGLCRIITVVHRPSDIIGGFTLWILVPLLLSSPFFFPTFKKCLITPCIKFQERFFTLFTHKKWP